MLDVNALTATDIQEIVRHSRVQDFNAQETIFHLGDIEKHMFFIIKGNIELIFEGGKDSKVIGKDNFFGELAFVIGRHRRTATAIARTSCTLAIMDQSTIDNLIMHNPELLFSLFRETCSYLLQSEQGLIAGLKQKNNELRQTIDYLRRTREELDFKELVAQTDSLTGLYNRRCLDLQLEKFVDRAEIMRNLLGILLIDLDNFKRVNDTFGHQTGDAVLIKVAQILKRCTRRSDLVCRLGGDEFVILLPDATIETGIELAEKIRAAINDSFSMEQRKEMHVTASIGVTNLATGESSALFLERADRLLYQAKELGRNKVVHSEYEEIVQR